MDFDQLETFLEVARHSSFSRAAEKRFTSGKGSADQADRMKSKLGVADECVENQARY